MIDQPTVQPTHPRAEADLAPQPMAMPVATHGSTQALPGAGAREFAGAPATKRQKTSGERIFDIGTYGGFALVGNEVAATAIVKSALAAIEDDLHEKPLSELKGLDKINGAVGKAYVAFDKFFNKANPGDRLSYLRSEPGKQSRFTYISFAIIGGFLMVPFIKALEDHKGKVVRFFDRQIHGRKAETDPQLVEAHKEMDEAPKQSWGSLGKGRILTVAAAYGVDATVNWDQGLSARLLGEKWSMESLSNRFATTVNKPLTRMRKLSETASKNQLDWLKNGFGLLTLSTALTVLFYATSKLFASRRDHKKEHAQETSRDRALAETMPAQESASSTVQLATVEQKDQPHRVVHAGQLENTLAATGEREVRA